MIVIFTDIGHLQVGENEMMRCSVTPLPPHLVIESRTELVCEEELDQSLLLAEENGRQEANFNSGYHCDPVSLGLLHPLWNGSMMENGVDREKRVGFLGSISRRVGWDSGEETDIQEVSTDFTERGERPLCKAVKIVEAVFSPDKTIIPVLASITGEELIQGVDDIMRDIIATLEMGERYNFNDSSSIRINYTPHTLNTLLSMYVVFQYFVGLPPPPSLPTASLATASLATASLPTASLPTASSTTTEIATRAEVQQSEKPKLQRLAPRSLYCNYPK